MPQDPSLPRPQLTIRIQDGLVALMFGALIVLAHNWLEQIALAALASMQLIEGRLAWLMTAWGRATSVLVQLLICFLLLGWTYTLSSEYYPILLLPVVSAATYLGLAGTVATSFAFIAAYLSFLLPAFVDWSRFIIDADSIHALEIRCLSLAVAALLVNSLGEARRAESVRYRQAAEQLALANRNLLDAEAAVRRSERLAALGQLSAGLAHELRNPLSSIKGSADLLARSGVRDEAMARELAGIISDEVDRTNLLVTRFLDFARPLEPRRELVNLTSIIDRAANHAKVPIIRNYSPDVPPLSIDPALMEQVFINLLSNAAQASAPNAPITVQTRFSGDEAEVSVVDRGCGISSETIETIFNPFVTTKQTGVGLGLAIVAKIVDGHGGRMAVESEPGKGSSFRVYLPVQQ
ncbi:MAG: ATP-binding protein [Acidobacteriota bacterium]|nr:ATP-binding protein [Acidobacteriota bacterium]